MQERESRGQRRKAACVAIVTILALLIAPFCAPLCSAKICAWTSAGGASQASDCHHEVIADEASGANSLNAQQVILAAATPTICNPQDGQPATLSAAKGGSGLFQTGESAPHFLSSALTQSRTLSPLVNPATWLQSSSFSKSDISSATTVLRI